MGESKPIPVRLGDDLIDRLDQAAEGVGSTRSAIIRLLIRQFVEEYEERGDDGLPVNWRRLVKRADEETGGTSRAAEDPPGEYQARTRAARAATGAKQRRKERSDDGNDIGPAAR